MITRWRAVASAALLLALGSALTVAPTTSRGSGGFVGTAQAARGNFDEDIAAIVRAAEHDHDVINPDDLPKRLPIPLPKYKPPVLNTGAAARIYRIRKWAETVVTRLLLEDWTCDTAEFLEGYEKIDKAAKAWTTLHAELDDQAPDDEAPGFVEQAAELGRQALTQLTKASCEDG